MYTDQIMSCVDCGADFTFTASEQEFYDQKGFTNPPKRCGACRSARKQSRGQGGGGNRYGGGGGGRSERQMYAVVCVACGCETTVPFRPTQDRPVYCRSCYQGAPSH